MKRIVFFAVIVIGICFSGMGQIASLGNDVWTECSIDSRSNSIVSKRQYWIENDTVINGQVYKKIVEDKGYMGAIREDNGKVYAILKWEEHEFLLCDYTVQIGDAVISNALEGELSYPHVVVKIEEMTMKTGEKRKLFFLDGGMTWIEGIGSIHGLFHDAMWHTTNFMVTELVCFRQGDEILYRNEDRCQFDNCCDNIATETINSITLSAKLKIRKKNDQLVVVLPETFVNKTTIRLFDMMGNCICVYEYVQNPFELNISDYTKGICLISVQNENEVEYCKFIK